MTHPTHRPAGQPARAPTGPPIVRVTLLTQDDCHYCEHAKAVLARVGHDHPLQITEIGLRSDEGRRLATRAGVPFPPGILLDGRPFGYGRLSERKLRRALKDRAAAPGRQ
jgi:hypothetical protein